MFAAILAAIAGITRLVPALEKWGDWLYGAWKDAQQRALVQRAADAAARQDTNAADLNALRTQAAADAATAAAKAEIDANTKRMLAAKAASELADAPAPPKP